MAGRRRPFVSYGDPQASATACPAIWPLSFARKQMATYGELVSLVRWTGAVKCVRPRPAGVYSC